jgi:hypothetical protein
LNNPQEEAAKRLKAVSRAIDLANTETREEETGDAYVDPDYEARLTHKKEKGYYLVDGVLPADTVALYMELVRQHGKHGVWTNKEVREAFEITGFVAGFSVGIHRESGEKMTLDFTHRPRFYFGAR